MFIIVYQKVTVSRNDGSTVYIIYPPSVLDDRYWITRLYGSSNDVFVCLYERANKDVAMNQHHHPHGIGTRMMLDEVRVSFTMREWACQTFD